MMPTRFTSMRPRRGLSIAAAILWLIGPASLTAQPGILRGVPAPAPLRDGQHDFDGLQGTWDVTQTHLRHALVGMPPDNTRLLRGRSIFRVTPDGQRVIEESELVGPDSNRVHASTVMLYGPATRRWTIYVASADAGTFDAPLAGSFGPMQSWGRAGEFYGQQEREGHVVFVRLTWRLIGMNHAAIEVSYSADGGARWETEWRTDLTRIGDVPERRPPPPPPDTLGLSPYERVLQRNVAGVNGPEPPVSFCCGGLDVREYLAPASERATLITEFARENAIIRRQLELTRSPPAQEPTVMENVALLQDIDRPEHYVWIRSLGFDPLRFNAGFFAGSLWAAHRRMMEAAKITIGAPLVVGAPSYGDGFLLGQRPARDSTPPDGIVVATLYTLPGNEATPFGSYFLDEVTPHLYAAGARVLARLPSNTTYSGLLRGLEEILEHKLIPEREPFIWFMWFPDTTAYARYQAALERDADWTTRVRPYINSRFIAPPQTWRLVPIGRSRIMF